MIEILKDKFRKNIYYEIHSLTYAQSLQPFGRFGKNRRFNKSRGGTWDGFIGFD